MNSQNGSEKSISHDAAVAASLIVMEEFFGTCPNGIAEAIHYRLVEIIQASIESVEARRWINQTKPSLN
jgi:hypothetical protein